MRSSLALDPHVAPTHVDTRSPIYAAALVAVAFRECPRCHATGQSPCVTPGGKRTSDHRGRSC